MRAMQHDPRPLDYRTTPRTTRVRPRLWLSHMLTAAGLCLAAIFVDYQLRFDWGEARPVTQIEVALAIYGTMCAIMSMARGALSKNDKIAIAVCLPLFAITAVVGLFMPRVIHN
jgi:predicted MFS family arabinose efflux permease